MFFTRSLVNEKMSEAALIAQSVKKICTVSHRHHVWLTILDNFEWGETMPDVHEEKKIAADTGKPLKVISVKVLKTLDCPPEKLTVNIYKRPQYALPDASGSFQGVLAEPH